MWKIIAYIIVLRAEIATSFGSKMVGISTRNTKMEKVYIANFANILSLITQICQSTIE